MLCKASWELALSVSAFDLRRLFRCLLLCDLSRLVAYFQLLARSQELSRTISYFAQVALAATRACSAFSLRHELGSADFLGLACRVEAAVACLADH